MSVMSTQDFQTPNGRNLAERIRRLASGRPTLDVAQFQFIGLKDIRARYGDEWSAKRDRVQQVAGHFIAKRLAPEEVMIPGADGFLVVFGQRTGLAADAASQRISKALNDFFIGENGLDWDVRFEARRKEMSVEDLTGAFGDLGIEADASPAPVPAPPAVVSGASPFGARRTPDLPALPAAGMTMAYQPVWDVRREALTTSFIVPIDPRTGERAPGYQFDAEFETSRNHAELDERQLRASETALQDLFDRGGRTLLGVSVHVSSLATEAALARLSGILAGFDRRLMRYRLIRIAGVEPGYPRIYLEDAVRALKVRAPNIAISLHWSEPDIASILRLQLTAVGFSLPPESLGLVAPRAELFARVRQGVEAAHQQRTPFFVEGRLPADVALRFAGDGVDNLSSPLLWPVRPDLAAAGRWPAARLSAAA